MITILIIYFCIYVLIVGAVLVAALVGMMKSTSSEDQCINLDDLTVVIPFRNEEEGLKRLGKNLERQTGFPSRIIFVNDHSEDGSAKIIRDHFISTTVEVHDLPDEIQGKKGAIAFATEKVNTAFTLTLDADVEMESDYFINIQKLPVSDMLILPVHMTGESIKKQVFSTDVTMITAINIGVAQLIRPILASGANLLFRTETYRAVSRNDHHEISSGDDVFLLRDFRRAKKQIRLISDNSVAVRSIAPATVRELIDQRVRWLSKTFKVADHLSTFIAGFQLILALAFVLVVIYSACFDLPLTVFVVLSKLAFDTLLLSPHFINSGNSKGLLFFPMYDLLYPFYSLLIGIISLVYKPRWKGRQLKV